jgi:hypothetical protein
MKKLTLVLTIAALALPQAGKAGWFRTYGGTEWDEGRCVQEVDDGYIVTGFTHPDTLNSTALWLFKTDTLGNVIWSKAYGGTGSLGDQGYFVRQTYDGGYVIAGKKWTDAYQIWLLKTDSEGDTVWTRTFGPSIGYCMKQTDDGGYIITGRGGSSWFPFYLFLLKIDSQGDSLWMRNYVPNGWVYSLGRHLEITEDGSCIVSGLAGDTTFENERKAFWLLKTDSVGTIGWSYLQGGENWGDEDYGRCVRNTMDENYIALANFGLINVSDSGDTLWTKEYQDGSSIDITVDGGYAITGNAIGWSSIDLKRVMPDPLWLTKTNDLGDSLWKQFYSDGLSEYVEETSDKGFIITGGSGGDLFLLRTDSLGLLGITENPIVETDYGWNVPHSIGNYVVLHYQGLPRGFRANVFDVSGRQVDQIRGDGNEGAMTWGISQPPGVYFIQALDNQNQIKTAKVVLVR